MFRFIAENKAKRINLRKPTGKSNKNDVLKQKIEYRNVSIFGKKKKKKGGQTRIK